MAVKTMLGKFIRNLDVQFVNKKGKKSLAY